MNRLPFLYVQEAGGGSFIAARTCMLAGKRYLSLYSRLFSGEFMRLPKPFHSTKSEVTNMAYSYALRLLPVGYRAVCAGGA